VKIITCLFLYGKLFSQTCFLLSAVMTAGNIGWGCGSGPNAVANEKAVMDQYGWHNIAWVLYPSFAVIIDDIYNPIFLSIFGGLFKG
jgi:ESS family glutamate:Na+ symporter